MKALKPAKKWVLAAIGLLLALLILKIVLFLTTKPKITVDYVAEYNRTARPQDYDPNDNAAENYQKAYDAFAETPGQLRLLLRDWPTDFNEPDLHTLRKWLASNEQAFEYFRKASRKPYYWLERKSERDNTVAGIMVPELNPFRELTRALLWDAKIKATNGQFQSAFETVLDCYSAGQYKCRPSLLLVEQHNGLGIKKDTVRSAFVILDNSKVEDNALEFLLDGLQSELNNDDYIPDVQTEKYFLYDALQRTFIDNGKGTGRLAWRTGWYYEMLCGKYNNFSKRLYACFAGPTQNEIVGQIEKVLAMSAQIMAKTPWDIKNETYDFFDEIETINNSNWFLQIFGVSPEDTFELHHKTRAQTEALVATLATLRYKIDAGQYPKTLDKLVSSDYLQAVPNDPYSNSSLVYKLTEDGFKLYSVGADFKDDDGVVKLDIIYWPVQQQREIDIETKKGPGEIKLNRNLGRVKS